MKKGLLAIVVLAALAVAVAAWVMSINNQLVALQEQNSARLAQVETVLQRRYELIPNLVETVKGFASHEKEILTEVTRLRSQWGQAQAPAEKAQAANQLEGALSRLLL